MFVLTTPFQKSTICRTYAKWTYLKILEHFLPKKALAEKNKHFCQTNTFIAMLGFIHLNEIIE